MKPNFKLRAFLAASAVLAASQSAYAASGTWTADADGLWTATANWSGGTIADGSGFTANFTADITADRVITLGADRTIGNITFTDNPTISNNLTISGGNILTLAGSNRAITLTNTTPTLTISSQISGTEGLQKEGLGTLILSGANNYTGTTTINRGTIRVDTGGSLGANTALLTMGTGTAAATGFASNLTLNTSDSIAGFTVQSNTSDTTTASNINQLNIASGSTLTATSFTAGIASTAITQTINTALGTGSTPGAGGTFTVNGNMTIGLQGSNTGGMTDTVVDLSGLHTLNVTSTGTGYLRVGYSRNAKGTLTLANNANTINVGTLSVGDSISGNYHIAGVSHLYLGAGTNALQAPTINIGASKGAGQILFSGSSGSVTITGANGSGTSTITIGNHSAASYQGSATNSLLLAGHTATVSASTVTLSQISGNSPSGGNDLNSLLTFDTGTFNATSIQMADATTTAKVTHATSGTFTVGGDTANSAATGIVNVTNDVLLGKNTNSTAGNTGAVSGTLTINGGTVNVNTAASTNGGIFDASTSTTASSLTSTLTLAGGTLNLNGGRIGGTLGTTAGKRNIDILNFHSGTLSNVLSINGNAGLTKTTSGTLTLTGTNSYTGATLVSGGKLAINGSLANSAVTVGNTATLQGSGFIVSSVTIQNGGTLAPGNSIESIGTGNLSFEAGSTYAYEFQTNLHGSTPNVAADLTYSTGTLDITAGAILTLTDLAASVALADGTKFTLISYFGGWTGSELFSYDAGSGLTTLADDSTFTLGANQWLFNYNDTTGGLNYASDQIGATSFVTMTVIPEPRAALLSCIGLLFLLRRKR